MKKTNLFLGAFLGLLISGAAFAADVVNIKGAACEEYSKSGSKSSTRVRVTDRASFNAAAQVKDLAELRANMPEQDFNVIIYNLVDNYVGNLTVRTTAQTSKELCVEVTGIIPARDIVDVIANYSSHTPAPEYDFKKANNIEQTSIDELSEEEKTIDFAQATPTEEAAKPLYDGSDVITNPEPVYEEPQAGVLYSGEPTEIALEESNPEPAVIEEVKEEKTKVFVAATEFYNNTHSSKPSVTIRQMFMGKDGYEITENPNEAAYSFYPKVLKAKVDALNDKTKRLQMVVSLELKSKYASVSSIEHQNRFVLFEDSETEQTVAQNLLKKLMQKAANSLYPRVESSERKRKNSALPSVINPFPNR